MEEKRHVKLKDAPKYIPFSEKTLRNWRSNGDYPTLFFKFGGTVFVDLDEYERLIQQQKDHVRSEAESQGLQD